jgi:acyl carrier protein phosphodiesterase
MNWLAHLYLSEPNAAFRIGNLLPDLAPASALLNLPMDYLRGVQQHRRIDAFTDSHPIFKRSIGRVDPEFRRFGGILVDMFYDHFLARDWPMFSAMPLRDFTNEVYSSFENHRHEIPAEAYGHLERMKSGDWLCSYGDFEGLAVTLGRIGLRLRKPVPLANAVSILKQHYALFEEDFSGFFVEVVSHVRQN